MALHPENVHVLQHQWMHDDLSTITNAYPDHEDIQGPAGHNVPEVMTNFVPRTKLITSEDQMMPILAHAARGQGTVVRHVDWIEAGLLTQDTLGRFAYAEHPFNVALVLAMADELGIDRDFALKEMADHVVPDIGALKLYPRASIDGRTLEFASGMSANERKASVENWTRLQFDRQDPYRQPGVWVSTLVNNRSDRIPRSQQFAQVIVNDMLADRHFLIGDNLTGLVGYIRDAWTAMVAKVSLWGSDREGGGGEPGQVLRQQAVRQRIALEPAHLRARLEVMLSGLDASGRLAALADLWADPDALARRLVRVAAEPGGMDQAVASVVAHAAEGLTTLEEYQGLVRAVAEAGPAERGRTEREFKSLLWKWFSRKLVLVEDYHIKGDRLTRIIASHTPPGFLNRIMGVQNIKGPGLDFVYRWQAWDACRAACNRLRTQDPDEIAQGLSQLDEFTEFGILSEEYVLETIRGLRERPVARSEKIQTALDNLSRRHELAMKTVRHSLDKTERLGALAWIVSGVESLLETGDTIRRRKAADQIYEDLVHLRIGQARAVAELQALNKRQHGGWLLKRLRDLLGRLNLSRVDPGG
ncbi:MAG: hypothetical protein HY815_16475 [Candidatus Riflebacteria bacterium]|nr:hypothetical protein [Candidatus Riflebacteria bacterium]